ncbi:MAG: IPT/TIG domain-containing protein [Myxococcota bacterium]
MSSSNHARVVLLALAATVAACSTPPTVTGVDPSEGPAGTEFKIIGTGFSGETTVFLASEGDSFRQPLALTSQDAVVMSSKIPESVAAGTYTVVVAQGGVEVHAVGGFVVTPVVVDQPCARTYTANTMVSLATKEVVVDRFHLDDRRETLRVSLDDVQAVDFEKIAVEGGLCSVIYLRQTSGERLPFQDDVKVDLKARAYRLGQELGKPVSVTREDPAPAKAQETPG